MRASVRRRVTWIVILSALLPLLVVWGITLGISYRSQQRTAQDEQVALTNLIADDFGRFVLNTEAQLQVFADTINRIGSLSEVTDDRLVSLVLSSSSFREVALYNSEGQRQAVAARNDTAMPESIVGTPLFEQIKTGQPFYGDPLPLPAGTSLPLSPEEVPRLRIGVSVLISFDERMYLVGDISMDQLWQITNRIEASTGARLLVLTADGALVSAGKTQFLIDHPTLSELPLIKGGDMATYRSTLGNNVLGVRAQIVPPGWILVVERELDLIYEPVDQLALSLFIVILIALPVVAAVGWLAGRRIAGPIQQLHRSVESFANDPLSYQPVVIGTGDEVTRLGDAFNTMVSGLNESQVKLARANEELEGLVATRTVELQQALQEVQVQYGEQERLLETVRRLGMPVIPITRGMVVMPLVGEFTATRAVEISSHLLGAVERERARIVLMDITGVPTVDEDVARALINTVGAARLLGTEVILAGIRPDMAETLVSLGVGLSGIRTAATLEQAFVLGMDALNARRRRF